MGRTYKSGRRRSKQRRYVGIDPIIAIIPDVHEPPRIAIFLSGRGSNALAIAEAIDRGEVRAELALIVSNTVKAGGLAIAEARGIPGLPLNPSRYPTPALYVDDLLRYLRHHEIDVIVLAGYLKQLPPALIAAYRDRILNIHPSLLPKHGGAGMYGLRVHAAVLSAGDLESGATVHVVTEDYDEGPAVASASTPILPGDTAESLAARVLTLEHRLFPLALQACLEAWTHNKPAPTLGRVLQVT